MTTSFCAQRRTNPLMPVRRVAIVGGTHGNEVTGIASAKHWLRDGAAADARERWPSVDIDVFFANTRAIREDRRYSAGGTDLNRCFTRELLAAPAVDGEPWERGRAREINARLGPKDASNPRADVVFDLHNTTANTGVLLCMSPDDAFAHQLAAHAAARHDARVRVANWSHAPDGCDHPFLPSLGRSGMTVEVGAVAHSTVHGALVARTVGVVEAMLDYIELHNRCLGGGEAAECDPRAVAAAAAVWGEGAAQAGGGGGGGDASPPPTKRLRTAGDGPQRDAAARVDVVALPTHEGVARLDYPREPGGGAGASGLAGFVHPSLQGRAELADGATVAVGAPLFALRGGGGGGGAVAPLSAAVLRGAFLGTPSGRAAQAAFAADADAWLAAHPLYVPGHPSGDECHDGDSINDRYIFSPGTRCS